MSKVSLSKTSGKIFWASLLVYVLAYCGFFFFTQYTHSRISYEDEQGAFTEFKDVICKDGIACTDVKYLNVVDVDSKYSKTQVDLTVKNGLNESLLQQNYQEFKNLLPWYVRLKFEDKLVIKSINGKPFKAN